MRAFLQLKIIVFVYIDENYCKVLIYIKSCGIVNMLQLF